MGYLDAFPTAHLPPSPTSPWPTASAGGSPKVPLRSERAHCWAARDGFFACLDRHGVVDSLADPEGKMVAESKCSAEDQQLKRDCARSWIKYFKERRVMEHKKAAMYKNLEQEGAQPLGQTLPGIASGGSTSSGS